MNEGLISLRLAEELTLIAPLQWRGRSLDSGRRQSDGCRTL